MVGSFGKFISEKRLEKYSGNKYGEYKSSGIYKPY